nr:hypothetical protein [Burkholderia ubonensis]
MQRAALTSFIAEVRRRELRPEVLLPTDRGINTALELGEASGEQALDPQTDELVAALITWHDDQLRAAQCRRIQVWLTPQKIPTQACSCTGVVTVTVRVSARTTRRIVANSGLPCSSSAL